MRNEHVQWLPMQYQHRSDLGYTVLSLSEEVFLRSWSLLSSHVRVASQQLQKSAAGQLIIAVSSTSPTLPTACPCTMDAKSRFSSFSSWIPCLSPGDCEYLLNFPFLLPYPSTFRPLAGLFSAPSQIWTKFASPFSGGSFLKCVSRTHSLQFRQEGELRMACFKFACWGEEVLSFF